MRQTYPLVLLLALSGLAFTGCQSSDEGSRPDGDVVVVFETLQAQSYTYAQVMINGEPTWFAGPELELVAGDSIEKPSRQMPMKNFESRTLERTFDVVYFVDELVRVDRPRAVIDEMRAPEAGAADGNAEPPAEEAGETPVADASAADYAVPEGGQTVAGVFALGKAAAGQEVVFRGRVVKSNANILGRNWLHVQDGTGTAGTNDITVTTEANAEVGDTVVVRGTLAADRDFGAGYVYDLIVEDATLTVE